MTVRLSLSTSIKISFSIYGRGLVFARSEGVIDDPSLCHNFARTIGLYRFESVKMRVRHRR
jgi:hypothetical protein